MVSILPTSPPGGGGVGETQVGHPPFRFLDKFPPHIPEKRDGGMRVYSLCTVFLYKHIKKIFANHRGQQVTISERIYLNFTGEATENRHPFLHLLWTWITKGNRVGTGQDDPWKSMHPNPRNMAKSCRNNCCNRNCCNLTHSCPPPPPHFPHKRT